MLSFRKDPKSGLGFERLVDPKNPSSKPPSRFSGCIDGGEVEMNSSEMLRLEPSKGLVSLWICVGRESRTGRMVRSEACRPAVCPYPNASPFLSLLLSLFPLRLRSLEVGWTGDNKLCLCLAGNLRTSSSCPNGFPTRESLRGVLGTEIGVRPAERPGFFLGE
jgi:hypothetical protein